MQPHNFHTEEVLPLEFQKRVDKYITWALADEKAAYKNDLKPFALHEQEVKEQVKTHCAALQQRLQEGQKLLKDHFTAEEEKNPLLAQEFSLASLEQAIKLLEERRRDVNASLTEFKSLQAELGIPWSFMDRAFQAGKVLLQNKSLEQASHVFFFLRFMQPRVFDYWVAEATCLHELGKFQEAVDIYEASLAFQPKNPLVFFQMASCLFRLNEVGKAVQGFEACVQAAAEQPRYADLHKEAVQIKSYLQGRSQP
jgi:tetratricopeptide (TPR) repeat protein